MLEQEVAGFCQATLGLRNDGFQVFKTPIGCNQRLARLIAQRRKMCIIRCNVGGIGDDDIEPSIGKTIQPVRLNPKQIAEIPAVVLRDLEGTTALIGSNDGPVGSFLGDRYSDCT